MNETLWYFLNFLAAAGMFLLCIATVLAMLFVFTSFIWQIMIWASGSPFTLDQIWKTAWDTFRGKKP